MSEQKSFIPLSVPHLSGNEWTYVKECLDTGWVSSLGAYVNQFEEKLAEFVGAPFAIATASGTAALHVAMLVAGIEGGDEVLVPTITFAATINAIRYCGAEPVFFDCDKSLNIDLDAVETFLSEECERRGSGFFNRASGRRVSAIIPVHVFGFCVDMERLERLAAEYSLAVVEDAAEALGSSFKGRHAGTWGTLGCFSFNGNKIVTTGGGGMVVTHSEQLASKIRYLSTQAKDDPIRFIHDEVGYNYRLTNIQAAVGVAQLEQLPRYIEKKREIFARYRAELGGYHNISFVDGATAGAHNYWLTNIVLEPDRGLTALEMVKILRACNIEARPVWYPNHAQRPNQGCLAYRISRAAAVVEYTVSLPSSVGLTAEEQERVVAAVKQAYDGARIKA